MITTRQVAIILIVSIALPPASLVIHTLAYFRGTFPLCLKGRFYAKLVFMSKGKILRHCCLYVLNGNILRQTNDAKPNAYMHIQTLT